MQVSHPFKVAIPIAAAVLLAALGCHASAQTTAPIRIVVPSTAGGGADILARVLTDQIGRDHSATMVVENRPGASNTIGTEIAARAAPDGNTLLINTPEFVINPHLRKLNYDPLTSFIPVCYLARSPQLLVANQASPYRTLGDLLAAARAKPGELTLASAGPASSPHLAFESLQRRADIRMTYVPYQGSTPAVSAVLGGQVSSALASYPNVIGQIRSGALRALATASQARLEQLPDVPTVAEQGFRDYEADIWFGVVAPANTPGDKIARLADWFTAALRTPEVKSKLDTQGLFTVGLCGDAFGGFIRKQYEESGRIIRDANITAD